MYKLLKDKDGNDRTDVIIRVLDWASVPNDAGNRDWINYQVWLSEGNTPEASE